LHKANANGQPGVAFNSPHRIDGAQNRLRGIASHLRRWKNTAGLKTLNRIPQSHARHPYENESVASPAPHRQITAFTLYKNEEAAKSASLPEQNWRRSPWEPLDHFDRSKGIVHTFGR
jgi:hypothetical protein